MFFDSINGLQLPHDVDVRLRELKRRDSTGTLTQSDKRELDLLNEADQALSSIRAKAQNAENPTPPRVTKLATTIRNGLPVVVVPEGTRPIDPEVVRRYLQEEGF